MDMHPGERMFFFTTTGWMMWNFLVEALLVDVVPVLYDGNPAYPEPDVLWSMVERTGASYFGASPTYVSILEKAGIVPEQVRRTARPDCRRKAPAPRPRADELARKFHIIQPVLVKKNMRWLACRPCGSETA